MMTDDRQRELSGDVIQKSSDVRKTDAGVSEYTDEDMAVVGRAFMEAIEQNRDHPSIKDWAPAQCPSEIIVDLINYYYDLSHFAPLPQCDAEAFGWYSTMRAPERDDFTTDPDCRDDWQAQGQTLIPLYAAAPARCDAPSIPENGIIGCINDILEGHQNEKLSTVAACNAILAVCLPCADTPSNEPAYRIQIFQAAERANKRHNILGPSQTWLEIFMGEMLVGTQYGGGRRCDAGSRYAPGEPFPQAVSGPDVALHTVYPVVEHGVGTLRVIALACTEEAQSLICAALSHLAVTDEAWHKDFQARTRALSEQKQ